jgi:hypothetical protein
MMTWNQKEECGDQGMKVLVGFRVRSPALDWIFFTEAVVGK